MLLLGVIREVRQASDEQWEYSSSNGARLLVIDLLLLPVSIHYMAFYLVDTELYFVFFHVRLLKSCFFNSQKSTVFDKNC